MASQADLPPHPDPSPIDAATFWYRQARRVRRKVNCGWWLQYFGPMLCGLSTVWGVAILTERYLYRHSGYGWAGFGMTIGIAMLICRWWAKPRFYSPRDGLVHLEAALRLHNRLSAAHAGVCPWPPAQAVHDGLRWRSSPIVWPLTLVVLMLNAAAWLPLQPPSTPPTLPTHPPVAWERIETALDSIEQSNLLQDKSIDTFRNPLAALQQQPPKQWYTHPTLEASDALRAQLEHTLEQLEHDLQEMASQLDKLNSPSKTPSKTRRELRESFNQIRDQLTLGRLPLSEQMRETLEMIDRDSLQGLSQSELADLKAQLRQGAASIREARRRSRHGRDTALTEDRRGASSKACLPHDSHCVRQEQMDPQGMASGGTVAGQGDITRGPGAAPLTLDPRPEQSRAGRIEVIRGADAPDENDDHTRKLSRSAPEIDRSQTHALSLGGAAPSESGRDTAVWKQTFTPSERDVLQRFFK